MKPLSVAAKMYLADMISFEEYKERTKWKKKKRKNLK